MNDTNMITQAQVPNHTAVVMPPPAVGLVHEAPPAKPAKVSKPKTKAKAKSKPVAKKKGSRR